MQKPVTRLNDCQYLLVSQINYTLTNVADHCEPCSHDAIKRSVGAECVTPRLVWENVRGPVVPTPCGSVLVDDTVLDQNASCAIALVRRPYSGNAQAVLKGIGVVPCVYGHPVRAQFWRLDSRLDDPEGDGQSKRDPVRDRLSNIVSQQHLPFEAVLMDTWYATRDLLWYMESLRLFRVAVSPHRTEGVVTNDQTPEATEATEATQEACGFRRKSEPLPREGPQVTGLERCQCRTARLQRTHIGGAFLVWVRLTALTAQTGRTIYQLKHGGLDDYLIQQLKSPSLKMVLA